TLTLLFHHLKRSLHFKARVFSSNPSKDTSSFLSTFQISPEKGLQVTPTGAIYFPLSEMKLTFNVDTPSSLLSIGVGGANPLFNKPEFNSEL
ncbi:MAG: hypothetical protein K2Q15_06555, partial [Burkholderiales bacterium]|nr:hypothetical protein [Burkholderiales bacterium]